MRKSSREPSSPVSHKAMELIDEMIKDGTLKSEPIKDETIKEEVYKYLCSHPDSDAADVSEALSFDFDRVMKVSEELIEEGKVECTE